MTETLSQSSRELFCNWDFGHLCLFRISSFVLADDYATGA